MNPSPSTRSLDPLAQVGASAVQLPPPGSCADLRSGLLLAQAGQYLNATPRSSVLVLGQAEEYQSPSQALSRLSDQVNAAK